MSIEIDSKPKRCDQRAHLLMHSAFFVMSFIVVLLTGPESITLLKRSICKCVQCENI